MSLISKRLSVSELSDRILDMAKTGVYRQSVLEALAPLATQKEIRLAIAYAKKFGLHSVSSLRDTELGTYYQLDVAKYESLRHALHCSIELNDEHLFKSAVDLTQTIRTMLVSAKALAISLLTIGILSTFINHGQVNLSIFAGAIGVAGVWLIQRILAQRVLPR
ncbi:MAG: hypothetical protein ACFE0J_02675 [Elainellaceae cyanobacterium]